MGIFMAKLRIAYVINLVVLLPIAIPTLFRVYPTDQGRFEESAGWRVLVGALWTAILVLSVLGLYAPLRYSPVLVLQLIYKTLWLFVFALPRVVKGNSQSIPWGIASSFIFIVLVWPWIIPWDYLLASG
jgi:hypothetical protein